MKLYHGSIEKIEQPKILYPSHTMDFGAGFYTTTNKNQAELFTPKAIKRNRLNTNIGVVSEYNFDKEKFTNDTNQYLEFLTADENWLDFIMGNRGDINFTNDYDIISGPVANDDVYAVLDAYIDEIITKTQLIESLKIRKLFDQYIFKTELSLKYLSYINSYEVDISALINKRDKK
jgi:hypothetical protein